MTTTYDSIFAHCATTKPALIYVSIGCAGNTYQQNPPFLDTQWSDEYKVLILIDPALEEVVTVESNSHRTVFVLHELFHWPSMWNSDIAGPHVAFLAVLFTLASAANSRTQVIIQDFTGEDIHQYFTKPGLDFDHHRILFDATYGIGGCTPDMKSAYILRATNGDFLQPRWLPLRASYIHLTREALAAELRDRAEILGDYAHRYYHVCKGTKEPREWCTEAAVAPRLTRLFYAYGIKEGPLCVSNLRALLAEGLRDFGLLADHHVLRETLYTLIDNPAYDYKKMLVTLGATALGISSTDKTRGHQ